MTTAQQYLNDTRERTGVKVTVTHLVIKALAEGLARCPTLNGKIVLGDYIPSSTVDIGCLVVLEREEGSQRVRRLVRAALCLRVARVLSLYLQASDLGNVCIREANTKSVVAIAEELSVKANKVRSGNDKDFEKSKPLLKLMPTWAIRAIVK